MVDEFNARIAGKDGTQNNVNNIETASRNPSEVFSSTMVTQMDDNLHDKIAGKKRKQETSELRSSKTLKEQVFNLIKVNNNLVEFLKNKLGASDTELQNCIIMDNVSFSPKKRNPRITPGVYVDSMKRKYYINSSGAYVYKRPCGKPKSGKRWCFTSGEWVEPGQEVGEKDANEFVQEDEEEVVPEDGEEVIPEHGEEVVPEDGEEVVSSLIPSVISDDEDDDDDEDGDEDGDDV